MRLNKNKLTNDRVRSKHDFESFLSVRVIYDHRMDVSVVSIMLNGDIFYIVYHELIKLRNFRGKIEVKISSCNMNSVKIGSVYDSEASNLSSILAEYKYLLAHLDLDRPSDSISFQYKPVRSCDHHVTIDHMTITDFQN